MTDIPSALTCANHPNRETSLRCNRCEKAICVQCAVLTPTGYRCRECVRGHQKVFENIKWYDYPVAIILAGGLSFLGSLIASVMGFFTIFIAPIAGVIIAETVRTAIRRRRSRLLYRLVTIALIVGALPLPLIAIVFAIFNGYLNIGIFRLIFQIVYIVLATSTAYYRLSGIQIR